MEVSHSAVVARQVPCIGVSIVINDIQESKFSFTSVQSQCEKRIPLGSSRIEGFTEIYLSLVHLMSGFPLFGFQYKRVVPQITKNNQSRSPDYDENIFLITRHPFLCSTSSLIQGVKHFSCSRVFLSSPLFFFLASRFIAFFLVRSH